MKKIIMIIILGVFSVIFYNIFLTFSPFSLGTSPVTYDPDIGMWHKKDHSGYIVKSCYRNKFSFDKQGRIKNAYEYNNKKNDVVLLGDSQLEALMVENSKILHNVLYKKLNGNLNVLNYGLSGSGATQQLEILKNKVEFRNVTKVIHLIFLENDLADSATNGPTGTFARPKVQLNFTDYENYDVIKPKNYDVYENLRDFISSFEIYVYLKKSVYFYKRFFSSSINKIKSQLYSNLGWSSKVRVNVVGKNNSNDFGPHFWTNFLGSIYQINKISKAFSIDYNIVFVSDQELLYGDLSNSRIFSEFLDENNIEYLNLFKSLKNLGTDHYLDFTCDSHWNGHTHNHVAKAIFEKFNF